MPNSGHNPQRYLVVDGGGTKTDCRIVELRGDEVKVLGAGKATGSNPAAIGLERAAAAVRAAVDQAMHSAGIDSPRQLDRAALAIAGTVDDSLRGQLEHRLSQTPLARRVRVFPDVLPIVLAASPDGPAAAVIAGTGSVAVARRGDGKYALAGGWGYLLGDEGSGYAIGREALRATLEQLETGEPPSPLGRAVLGELAASAVGDIKRCVYQDDQPRRFVAGLAPLVFSTWDADVVAEQILQRAAGGLVAVLKRALMRLDLAPDGVAIAAAGGLLASVTPMRRALERAFQAEGLAGEVCYVDDSLAACQLLLLDSVFNSPIEVMP